jgi:hypothetical protein
MKRFIPLLALFAAGAAASFALASPPGKGGPTTGSTTSHGNSGNHSQNKCHPVNLKGTVTGGTISLAVTKAAGKNAQQFAGKTVSLTINGNVSAQAWSCAAASSSGSAPTTQTLFLKQLHVGGSPQNLGSTTTTTSGP